MNNAIHKKTGRIVILAAVIAALVLGLAGARAASILPSKEEVTLKDGDTKITFDVTLETGRDFAGAEFGLKPSSSQVALQTLTFGTALQNEATVQKGKEGVQYFGFFAGSNKFKAGTYKVATLTYTYSGEETQHITLDSSKLVSLEQDGTTSADTSSRSFDVTIKRVKTEQPDPEDPVEVAALKKELEQAKQDLETLKRELADQKEALEKAARELSEAKAKLETAGTEQEKLQGQIKALTSEKETLARQMEELQTAKTRMEQQLAELQQEKKADAAALEQAKKDLAAANTAKNEAERSLEYLKGQLDTTTKMLDKLLENKMTSDRELSKARSELEQMKKELAGAQQALAKAKNQKQISLAKVGSLKAKGGKRSAALTWKAVKGAKGYQVYRSTGKYGKYQLVKTTSKTTWTQKKLKKKKTYYYKVRACRNVSGGTFLGPYAKAVKVRTK